MCHCNADATAVYTHAANTDIIKYKLQSDLNAVANWLSINVKKCKILKGNYWENIRFCLQSSRLTSTIHLPGEQVDFDIYLPS